MSSAYPGIGYMCALTMPRVDTHGTPFMPHGGYRKLRSYAVAQAVYDATVVFCLTFAARRYIHFVGLFFSSPAYSQIVLP